MQCSAFSWLVERRQPGRELPVMVLPDSLFELSFHYAAILITSSFLFLIASGYHVSSSVAVEESKWESRHLLQEIYDNESKLDSDLEKNCTEPGRTGWEAKCDRRQKKREYDMQEMPQNHTVSTFRLTDIFSLFYISVRALAIQSIICFIIYELQFESFKLWVSNNFNTIIDLWTLS